ncbi:MAG: hypothetical protein IH860_02100 [Chloroflexi bacterium]|nr:hypothetical protein [Chloroflexota bacterium]
MGKLIGRLLTLIGFLAVVGMAGVALAVGLLWWQDRQWQASSARENSEDLNGDTDPSGE